MIKILSLLPLLALLLAGCARPQPAAEHNHADEVDPMTAGTVLNPPTVLADFTLPSSRGAPISLADLKGRPTLVFFGFTNCPDVCPTTMAEFKRARDALGADGERVNYLLISVDPERDTPEVLARYVEAFDPAFVGLQGAAAYLLDSEARLSVVYSYGTPYTTFVRDIRGMLGG
jgi:protein SCO1/2